MNRRTLRVLLIAALLLATALRFYRLDFQSFWNDEGNTARLTERSLELIIEGTAGDIHPPLYYLVIHAWRALLGASEFALRSFSAFAGVLTVAGVAGLALTLYRSDRQHSWHPERFLAGIAALLAAVNPALVYYSQEARMYALLGLLTVFSTLALLGWSRAPRRRSRAAVYILLTGAGLYTHYAYPAVLLWQGVLVLAWLWVYRRWRAFWVWTGAVLLALLLYLPWLPIFLRQIGERPGLDTTPLPFFAEAFRFMTVGNTIAGDALPSVTIAFLILALLGVGRWFALLVTSTGPTRRARLLTRAVAPLALFIPLLFLVVTGATTPPFYKFLLITTPFFCLLVADGITLLWQGSLLAGKTGRLPALFRRLSAGALLLLLLWGSLLSLRNLYFESGFARADYRRVAAQIVDEGHPSAAVVLNAANQWEVFTYYYPHADRVFPLPTGRPVPEQIAEELSTITDGHRRIYALFWGEAERDPQRLVERWLDEHAFKAREEWVGDVRFVTYAVPDEPATEMGTHVEAEFGRGIVLEGYTLSAAQLTPGDILQISLFWRTEAPVEERYKVFLHLVDENGQIVAQRDTEPGGGLALTTTWPVDTTIQDNHGVLVPAGLTPGTYRLVLGLYELSEFGTRLTVTRGGEALGDSLFLTALMVEKR